MRHPAAEKRTSSPSEVVLVTGCSSGIGEACCRVLRKSTRRIYGSSRTACTGEGWEYTKLDVHDEASVQHAVHELAGREGRIDAVVHCAGCSLAGSIEDTTIEEAQRQFDTNFFGTARVLRAVLPIMRKQGRGKIIVIGSIGGLIGLPYIPYYSASKFALNGLIEALRLEVAPHGIDVTILHLGDFKTQISSKQVCTRNAVVTSPYHSAFEKTVGLYDRNVRMGRLPDIAARKIDKLLSRDRLPVRSLAGSPFEVLAVGLKSVLPSRLFEHLFRKCYGL
jgi:NAD(P)-dependent dehydrogenase (short-subunit alcohol dehydrogenase family)